MRRRLLLSYLSITVFVLIVLEVPLGIAYARAERRALTADVQHDALALTIRAEEGLEAKDPASLERLADEYQADTGGRVVIIDADGALVADSDPLRSGPRNLASRPELREALRGNEVSGTRYSKTLGHRLLYFAVPVVHGTTVEGALRVTYPTSYVDARIWRTWLVLAGIGIMILLIVFVVSLRLARQVTRPVEELANAAQRLGAGDLDARARVPGGPPELRELAECFNRTSARLDELVNAQQAFVADASHQLRSPLAALRFRLENLEASGEASEDVEGALAEVARLSRLVDGLLALARAERTAASPVDLDVAAIVDGRVDAWTALAAEKGVAIEPTLEAALHARATPGRIEQVLDNLLANALDVAPSGSTIRISGANVVNGAGPQVELRVLDEGPGMSGEERVHAFDRFWRAGGSAEGGSGLGLAIVHQLVVGDLGSVALEEAPGGGLCAVVTLQRV